MMFRASNAKKALAIFLTLALLASCMAVAGVSAATAQDYYYQFGGTNKWNVDESAYHSSYWSQGSNAPVDKDAGKASAKIVEAADNPTGSGYAMEMVYGANLGETKDQQCYSVFSLPNTTGAARDGRSTSQTIHLLANTTYEITIQYKVVNFVSAAKLYAAVNLGNLAGDKNGGAAKPLNDKSKAVLASITGATDGWVTQTAYFANTVKNGAYIVLKMDDDTNRAGTKVQIGSIKIQPVDTFDYTLDLNYGGNTSVVKAVAGRTIADIVETPTRPHGYTFIGWFDAAEGGNPVTAFPDASATLYAHWQAPAEPLYALTFDVNGGKLIGEATEEYLAGETITQTATRSGYKFLGWKNGDDYVTVAPAAAVTLTADWLKQGDYSPLDGLQSFENIDLSNLTFNTHKELKLATEENHTYAGATSLKREIEPGDNGQLSRPRLLLGDVTPGKSYTVSFWAKSAKAEPSGQSNNFKFYLAAYDKSNVAEKISFEGPWYSGINPDTHALQAMSNNNRGTFSADNGISNAALSDNLPTEWTQYTVTINSLTAHKNAAESCLVLGFTDNNSAYGVGADDWTNTLYIDDIQIAETDTLAADVQDYESMTVGSEAVLGTANGRTVVNEIMNHTFGMGGVGNTVKIDLSGEYAGQAGYTALYDKDGALLDAAGGSVYKLSAWLYSATDATVDVFVRATAQTDDWLGSSSAQLAETKNVTLTANRWTKIEQQVIVPTGEDYTALALGVAGNTAAVYVDDVSYTFEQPIMDYEQVTAGAVIGKDVALATDRNHTEGGSNSLKMTLSGTAKSERTFSVLNAVGGYLAVRKADTAGKMAQFYVYNPDDEAKTVTFAFGSIPTTDIEKGKAFAMYEISDSKTTVTLRGKTWTQVLVTTNSGIPVSGANVRSYVMLSVWGAEGSLYIDDLKFDDYMRVSMDPLVQSYERTTVSEDVSLQKDGSMLVVLDQNHSTSGMRSVRVLSNSSTVPQTLVTDGSGNSIAVEKFTEKTKVTYGVTFWVYAPEAMKANYWLCASDDMTNVLTAEQLATAALKNAEVNLVAGWNEITISDIKAAHAGTLRLAIQAGDPQKVLYLDDLYVRAAREKGFDPNATVQDFENFNVGDGYGDKGDSDLKFILKGNGGVSGNFSHSPLSNQSLRLETISWAGVNRNQFVLVDPKNGQYLEFNKGDDCMITFWVYMDAADSYKQGGSMSLNYWIMGTDDPTKAIENKKEAEFDIGDNSHNISIDCGAWYRVQTTFTVKNGKYMVIGMSDNTNMNSASVYYVDDIEITTPQHMTLRYHITEGATLDETALQDGMKKTTTATETIVEVNVVSDSAVSTLKQLTVDPYREGYQMTGWYTSPSCTDDTLFDLEYDLVHGSEGDVFDLYTGWAKWEETKPSTDDEKQEEVKYRDVIEWVKTWIGDNVEDPTLEAGDRPDVEEADPVSTKPKTDKDKNDGQKDGMATWLIIVIVAAAVAVVGGGAGLALVLLKKKKV